MLAEVTARPAAWCCPPAVAPCCARKTARCCAILAMCCICGPRRKIFKRVKHDRTRPLLQGEQPLQSCASCMPSAMRCTASSL